MFRTQASPKELASLSRNLGISLKSGVDIVRTFHLAARKGNTQLQNVLKDVLAELKSGRELAPAMRDHGNYFPDLFVDMISVGEQTGALPEVLLSLSEHYENTVKLQRDFINRITYPLIQLVAAILIIAALITLLGMIGSQQDRTIDPLNWGLVGTKGALIWLGSWAMLAVGGYVLYRMLTATLQGQEKVHRALLALPVIGPCLQSFAVARFSWAFHMTQDAGMPIGDSIEASCLATGNGAFIAAAPDIIHDVNSGANLTEALYQTNLFPEEFIETVLVAETSGTVPEALHRLSPQFQDNARRSMETLTTVASWLIWVAVAGFVIFLIFSIAAWYVNLLSGAMQ